MRFRANVSAVHNSAFGVLSRARLALAALFVCVGISTGASAGQVLIRYDANDTFPEEEGWTRYFQDPEDALQRELDEGLLRLDTRGSQSIFDLYEFHSTDLDPGAGQELRVDWRVWTRESHSFRGSSEVVMFLSNGSAGYVQFAIGTDHVAESLYLFGHQDCLVPIDGSEAHTYSLVTPDFERYAFYIDGGLALSGEFHDEAPQDGPLLAFGDGATGYPTSLAEWDFVAITIVPEPSCMLALGPACLTIGVLARKNRHARD